MQKFTQTRSFLLLLGALVAFESLTIDMYLPAFSDLQKSFNTSISSIELSLSAFLIGMALGQLIYGPITDRYGRKRPLLIGMVLYFFATLGCFWSGNIHFFIGFRALQALGGCAGMVITRAIVRDLFEKKRVAEFFSSLALVTGLAPITAPSLGALINHHFGWRAIFGFLAIANSICLACIVLFLPETLKKHTSHSTLNSYLNLLKSRVFMSYLVPNSVMRAGLFAYLAGSPFVFIELFHLPKAHYGLVFGINGMGLMAASFLNRHLLLRFDSDILLRGAIRFAAVAAFALFLGASTLDSPWATFIPLFCFIASLNVIEPNALAGALSSQGHQAGTAAALYGSSQWILGCTSSFLVSRFHNGTAIPMTGVILACGIVSVTSMSLLTPKR